MSWATEKEGRVSKEKLTGVHVDVSQKLCDWFGKMCFACQFRHLDCSEIVCGHDNMHLSSKCVVSFPKISQSSNDQSVMDTDIPYRLGGLVFAIIQLLCIIILVSQVVWPVIFLFAVVLAISFCYQAYYIRAGDRTIYDAAEKASLIQPNHRLPPLRLFTSQSHAQS